MSLTSKVDAMKLINLYPELSIINIDEPKNAKLFAILLPRGDQEWINFINHWISDQKIKFLIKPHLSLVYNFFA